MEWKAHTEGVFPRPAELTRGLGIARLFAVVPDGGAVVLQAEIALLLPGAWLHLPHHRAHLHGLQVSVHLGTCDITLHLGKCRQCYIIGTFFWHIHQIDEDKAEENTTSRLTFGQCALALQDWVFTSPEMNNIKGRSLYDLLQCLNLSFFNFFMLTFITTWKNDWVSNEAVMNHWGIPIYEKHASQSELGIIHDIHTVYYIHFPHAQYRYCQYLQQYNH